MKRLIPFYSFQRLVLPNFVKDILQNPGGITAEAVRAENNLRQNSGFVPDYVGQGMAIPLGESAPGTQKYATDSGILPIENLNDFIKPGQTAMDTMRRTGEALLGQSNPLLKGPLELMTGKQFFTDRDLRDLKTHFSAPPLLEQVIMNSPAARVLSTVSKVADPRKGVVEKLANSLTGFRTTDVDTNKARDIAAASGIEELMRGTEGAHMLPSHLYVDQQSLAAMTPDQQKLMALYRGIGKRAQVAAKERRKEALLTPAQ